MATPHLHYPAADAAPADTDSPAASAAGESVRFMCSFGGKIVPRPHDNQLRYVGGDTRIVSVPRRSTSFSSLLAKLSRLARSQTNTNTKTNTNTNTNTDIDTETETTAVVSVKYQLPNEDLDALITLASDEDLENMMDEHDRNPKSRLRLFLFFPEETVSRTSSSISSLLDGSTKRQNWFLDALNGGPGPEPRPALDRGRSEASSMVSEVPDYLFGLDSSDKTNKILDTVSSCDPGSPAPVATSPFCSASSSVPDLNFVPVENPVRHYVPDGPYQSPGLQQIPVYYVPGSNIPVHAVQVRAPFVQQFQPMPAQIPVGYSDLRSGMGQVYPHNVTNRVISDNNMNQPVYYRNPYTGVIVSGGDDVAVMGADPRLDRVNQPR